MVDSGGGKEGDGRSGCWTKLLGKKNVGQQRERRLGNMVGGVAKENVGSERLFFTACVCSGGSRGSRIKAGSWAAPRVMTSGVVRQWCVVMDNGDCGQRRVAGVEYERVHLMVYAVSLVCASDSYAASGASSLIFSSSLRYLQTIK